ILFSPIKMYPAPVYTLSDLCLRQEFHAFQRPSLKFCKSLSVNDITDMLFSARRSGIDILLYKPVGVQDDLYNSILICPDQEVLSQSGIFLSGSSHQR